MLAVSLTCLLLMTLAACGSDDDTESASDVDTSAVDTSAADTSAADTSAADTSAADTSAADTSAAESPTKSELVIGVPLSLSGTSAQSAAYAEGAIVAWEKWANDNGGINGHPVKLLIEDAGPDPVKSLAVVQDLIDNKNVVAIVGSVDTNNSSWLKYASDNNVPVLGVGTGNPGEYALPNQFMLAYPFTFLGQFMAETAAAEGVDTVGLGVCAEVAACLAVEPAAQSAAESAGVSYGGTIPITAAAPNFTAECLAMADKGIGMFTLLISSAPTERVITECTRQQVDVTYVVPNGPFNQETLGSFTGTRVITGLVSFPWWSQNPKVLEYRDAMEEYNPSASAEAYFATASWSTFMFFQKAMAELSDEPTREEIIDLLYQVKDEDLDGLLPEKVTFTAGQPSPGFKCYFLAEVVDGEFTTPDGDLTPRCAA